MGTRRLVLALFALSMALNAAMLLARFDWLCLPALLLGWYLADALSGLVHMTMDYWPCPAGRGLADIFHYSGSRESAEYLALLRDRTARINAFERLAYDFKNHHPRPDALGRRTLWRQIGSTLVLGALPGSLLLNALALYGLSGPGVALGTALLMGGAFAQYFHGTLHRADNPAFIHALRRCHLLMTPAAHQRHHDSLQRDFATNCGWSNPPINALFRRLRRAGHLPDSGLIPPP